MATEKQLKYWKTLKGKTPWNKGMPMSAGQKLKLSIAKTKPKKIKTCIGCSSEFEGKGKKYCSNTCKYNDPFGAGRFEKGRVNPNKGTSTFDSVSYNKDYYVKNKNKINAQNKSWYENNKQRHLENSAEWALKNKEKNAQIKREWRQRNRGTVQSWDAKRRALKQVAEGADLEKIKQFYLLAEKLTEQFGVKYCVDHIKPLNKGGLHHENNLQVITLSENSRKRDLYPYQVSEFHLPTFN